ncbi:MAG: hypothetical protein HZC41_23795 [Chloroflexi bacterium]|nr:hypothetical protein [Chloroflexota bacterium]
MKRLFGILAILLAAVLLQAGVEKKGSFDITFTAPDLEKKGSFDITESSGKTFEQLLVTLS